jgi:hypothetical protein
LTQRERLSTARTQVALGSIPVTTPSALPHGCPPEPMELLDLFDRHGTDALGYAPLCSTLSGKWVRISAFIVRTHDDTRWMLVDQAGACPDCAPVPVASLQLPGFELPPGTSTDVALTLRGRLSYGFLVGEDGYASFLRLEQAHLSEGTAS